MNKEDIFVLECNVCKKLTTIPELAKKHRCFFCNSKNVESYKQ